MTDKRTGDHHPKPGPDQPQNLPPPFLIGPHQLLTTRQTLTLLRYLVDVKNVPTEAFRQAARELHLPPCPPKDHEARRARTIAMLIRTYFDTEMPEPPANQGPPPPINRSPHPPPPHTWASIFPTLPPETQKMVIDAGYLPDSAV